MVDRLLDPAQRSGLPAADLTRLTDVVALGAAQHLPAGGCVVGGGTGLRAAAAGAAEPGGRGTHSERPAIEPPATRPYPSTPTELRPVSVPAPGAIDCDIHPALPSMQVLVPYLDEYWRSHVLMRGLERDNYTASAFPPNAPINCPPRLEAGEGQRRNRPRSAALTGAGCVRHALRHLQRPARRAGDVQRGPVGRDVPRDQRLAGRRVAGPRSAPARLHRRADAQPGTRRARRSSAWRPIRASCRCWCGRWASCRSAAASIGRSTAQPNGSTCRSASTRVSSYRHPPTNLGWPSYYLEDYVSWSTGFAGVLNSLIAEGVFVEFPRLQVVLMESGVTWLPGWMWRADKTWRGVRAEVPWLEKSPSDLRARARAPDRPAVRRSAARRPAAAHHRGDRLRRDAAVRHRLSALAFRRQGRAARRLARTV